jgi:hypothetical protein
MLWKKELFPEIRHATSTAGSCGSKALKRERNQSAASCRV